MKSEVNAVYLFIAELTGSFTPSSGTEADKIGCGQLDYINSNFPTVDLDNENDRKDLHEVMWLERLYNELDTYYSIPSVGSDDDRLTAVMSGRYRTESYKWTVPIELDATSSMCQYIGILLNDERLMNMTNVVGDTLEDAWKVDGMDRLKLKKALTPMLYGSAKPCWELWQQNKIEYNKEDIELLQHELAGGPFGLANLFKEFIINNCNMKPNMDVVIGDNRFNINCNRFRNVGERTKAYKIWDSIKKQYNIVLHTDTKRVPDLEQFRRFTVTLLIHNLDSVVMNNIMKKVMKKYNWGIPIHDAALVSPAAAKDVRTWYAEELEDIHRNRKSILAKFFKSIGISNAAKGQWETLQRKIVPFEGDLKVNPMALK